MLTHLTSDRLRENRAAARPSQGWLECVGITGWNGSESPAALRRNTHSSYLCDSASGFSSPHF
jgi:hypothetical protein